MNGIVDDAYSKLIRFKPEVNLENLKFDVDFNQESLQRVKDELYASSELIVDNIPPLENDSDREAVDYSSYILNTWNCL